MKWKSFVNKDVERSVLKFM